MRLEEVSDLGAQLIELGIEVQLRRSVSRISYFVAAVALPRGVPPPVVTTATWASATWRPAGSPRSCAIASAKNPNPWVRPADS